MTLRSNVNEVLIPLQVRVVQVDLRLEALGLHSGALKVLELMPQHSSNVTKAEVLGSLRQLHRRIFQAKSSRLLRGDLFALRQLSELDEIATEVADILHAFDAEAVEI